MRPIPFLRHRTEAQIRRAYLSCRNPVEKVRWHALWLLVCADDPRGPAQVARLIGLSDVDLRALLCRWNQLDVYSPKNAKNLPVVFWIHGGGWQTGDETSVQRRPMVFVDKGFVLVSAS